MGVIGGVPITETLDTNQLSGRFGGFQSETATRRYVVGGNLGSRISHRLSLQLGVLYRRFGYDYITWGPYPVPLTFTHFRTTGASFEAPALMRWSVVRRRSFAPYAALGATCRRLIGLEENQTFYGNLTLTNPQQVGESASSHPVLLEHRSAIAPTAAAGIDLRAGRLVFAPEIRYTRWLTDTLGGFADPIRWNWQRLDVLLGIEYPLGRH